MKLRFLLLVSHGLCFALGAVVMVAGFRANETVLPASAGAFSVAMLVAWILSRHVTQDLTVVEQAVTGSRHAWRKRPTFQEFDELAERARDYVVRWNEAVVNARQQCQAVQQLIARIDPDATDLDAGSLTERIQLLLADLSRTVDGELERVVGCAGEIGHNTRQIGVEAEGQTESVSKATTYVEQMSANIDTVSHSATAAQDTASSARKTAEEVLQVIRELMGGMNRIRQHVEAGEKKLRTLGERTEEIGSIVETIGAISDRTDMLALNASIESLRAGEHGRGFSLVAEEVRKLAEQAAQASHEVSELIQSVQRETHESISAMADERSRVETELQRVDVAGQSLERIGSISEESCRHVDDISQAMQHQLRLMQEVVLSMEQISSAGKAIRNRSDGVCWTTNTLTTLARQCEDSIAPLRRCASKGHVRENVTPDPGQPSANPGETSVLPSEEPAGEIADREEPAMACPATAVI